MPVEPELAELMTDVVYISFASAYSGGGYGIATESNRTPYKAWVEQRTHFIRASDGGMEEVTHEVYIDGAVFVSSDDKIELPDSFRPRTPRIIRSEIFRDERGPHHTQISCGAV